MLIEELPMKHAVVLYTFFHQADQIKSLEERLKKLEKEPDEEMSHSYEAETDKL